MRGCFYTKYVYKCCEYQIKYRKFYNNIFIYTHCRMNNIIKTQNSSYHFIEHRRLEEDKAPQDIVTCSENVAYDNISNTLKLAAPWTMTCSENVVYGTAVNDANESSMRNTHASHSAVYDEVYFGES